MLRLKVGFMSYRILFTKLFVALLAVTAIFTVFGQGCGGSMSSSSNSSSELGGTCTVDSKNIIDKNYQVVIGTRTVSIAYGEQLLDSYVSCTGIGAPSATTLAEWQKRNQSLSEYGSLTDISGAMMMGVAAVATEVCRDLIDKEMLIQPINLRGIFTQVNLQGGGLSSAEIISASNNLALSCWQRAPTSEEATEISNAIIPLGANSENGALALCSAMLSSLAAIEQ
jgi:hypothetical protein